VKKKKEGRDILQLGKGICISFNAQLLAYAKQMSISVKQQRVINVVKCPYRKPSRCVKLCTSAAKKGVASGD